MSAKNHEDSNEDFFITLHHQDALLPIVPTAQVTVVATPVQDDASWCQCASSTSRLLPATRGDGYLTISERPAGIPNFVPAYLKAKGQVDVPDNIKVTRTKDVLLLERKWGSLGEGFLFGCFVYMWIGVLSIISYSAFNEFPEMFLFTLPFDFVGLCLIYAHAQLCFNKTFIRVTPNRVRIEYHPLTLFTKVEVISLIGVQEICCKREVIHSSRKDTDESITFEVHGIVESTGEHRKIFTELSILEEALFLVQEMENFLTLTSTVKG